MQKRRYWIALALAACRPRLRSFACPDCAPNSLGHSSRKAPRNHMISLDYGGRTRDRTLDLSRRTSIHFSGAEYRRPTGLGL